MLSIRFYLINIILGGQLFLTPVAAQSYIFIDEGEVFSTFKFSSSYISSVKDLSYFQISTKAVSLGYELPYIECKKQ